MKNRNTILKVVAVMVVLAIAGWLLYKYNIIHRYDHQEVRRYIHSFGRYAILAFIIIFTLRTLLVIFPYSIMVIAGGSLFGTKFGFIYSVISVFLSASLAFYISRLLGKEFVQKLLRGKLKSMDSGVEENGFKVIFFMRFSMLFPLDILSYAAGVTKAKFKDFILGTVLGTMLETFLLSYFGHNLKNLFSPRFIFAAVLLLALLSSPYLYKYYKNKEASENADIDNKKSP